MLGSTKVIAFAAVRESSRARAFYGDVLGLRLLREDGYALVFDAGGTMLRVSVVPEPVMAPYTVLGWEVNDIRAAVAALGGRGVEFQHYGFPGQDESGIWTAPDGDKVAWFKDPDGNVLSVTQFVKPE